MKINDKHYFRLGNSDACFLLPAADYLLFTYIFRLSTLFHRVYTEKGIFAC